MVQIRNSPGTGAVAGIGRLDEALAILRGEEGTLITQSSADIEWRD